MTVDPDRINLDAPAGNSMLAKIIPLSSFGTNPVGVVVSKVELSQFGHFVKVLNLLDLILRKVEFYQIVEVFEDLTDIFELEIVKRQLFDVLEDFKRLKSSYFCSP